MIAVEEIAAAWIDRRPNRTYRWISTAPKHRAKVRLKARPPQTESTGGHRQTAVAEVCQQQTRQRLADGRELVHGTLRAAFVIGQRTAVEHLAFCPMLGAVPRITATAIDDADCAVRVTHVYRYGARLEIRLKEPCDEPVQVLIRYEARG
jgi:hypothetical protein